MSIPTWPGISKFLVFFSTFGVVSNTVIFILLFLSPTMSADGAEYAISYGEESIRSSSARADHSTHGAAPEASDVINSEPASVSSTVAVSSGSCVAASVDVTTDIDITTEPRSLPDYYCVSNINISGTPAQMVMTRSRSREMETTGDVPFTIANL